MGSSNATARHEINGNKIVSVRLGAPDKGKPVAPALATDIPLPSDAPARVKTLRADGKKWYVTVAYLPNSEQPFVIFCHTNHKEKTAPVEDAVGLLIDLAKAHGILDEYIRNLEDKILQDNNVSKLTRTISLLLRHQVDMRKIVQALDQVENVFVGSFFFQIKKFLAQHIKEGEEVEGSICAECRGPLVYSEGCKTCTNCGHSKCG